MALLLKEYLRPIHDRVLTQASFELGENVAASALAEGQAMEPDATFREALDICEIAQREPGYSERPSPTTDGHHSGPNASPR